MKQYITRLNISIVFIIISVIFSIIFITHENINGGVVLFLVTTIPLIAFPFLWTVSIYKRQENVRQEVMKGQKTKNKQLGLMMSNENNPDWLMKVSEGVIKHMNDDHSNSIVSTLHAQHGIKDKNAKMSKLEVNGYFTMSNNKLYFIDFENTCNSLEQYKTELIRNAKRYRYYELQ